MAININPVDFRGFSLGGSGTPQLPNVGALGLQAIQAQMNSRDNAAQIAAQERMNMARVRSADEAMLRQNSLERERLVQQQGQLNKNYGLEKRKLGLLEQQSGDEKGLKQLALNQDDRKIDLAEAELRYNEWKDNQKLAQEHLKLEMTQLKNTKKEEIANMGAFAVQARMAMDKVDPAGARTLQLSILDDAVKNGYISEAMAKQMKGMPTSSFKNALDFKIIQLNKVKEYQAINKIQNPTATGSGEVTITNADGTTIQVQGNTKPTQNLLQKNAIGLEKQLNNLNSLEKKLDESYLTYKGQATAGVTKLEEKMKGIPLADKLTEYGADVISGKTPEERKSYLRDMQAFANQTFQVFQDYRMMTTGMSAAYKEITDTQDRYLSGDMSFNQYIGSLQGIKSKYQSDLELIRKQMHGTQVSPDKKSISEMSDEELMAAYQGLK